MNRKKILLIENNDSEIQSVSNYLKSKGYEVVSSKNGFEGIFVFDRESPSLAIVDWRLPALSGKQVCQNFKKKKNHCPVIIVSDDTNPEAKRHALDAGCDEFVARPFNLNDLSTRIETLIQKSQTSATGKLEFGDLVIDREAHRVSRGGKPIDMSVTEYSLLEYLMENVDKVLTRKMILERVWGTSNPETFTNIVDVYINYLRKKIDAPGRRSLIKTVRGFGYMIEDIYQKKAA